VPPEPDLLEAIATDLGVDPSFVEKDWYAIRLVATIINAKHDNLTLVFSGGTSLSKGYGLIRRFSEDLDFKVLLPEAGIPRSARRNYRRAVVAAIRAENDWTLEDDDVEVMNDHRFFRCQVAYPTGFTVAPALRPRLQLEVTLARPALAPEERSLRSFVAEARQEQPEVWRSDSSGGVEPQLTAKRGKIEGRIAGGVVLPVLHLLQQQFEFNASGRGSRRLAGCLSVQGG